MALDSILNFLWPTKGKDEAWSRHEQPERTTPRAMNVLNHDRMGRARGASRPGTTRIVATPLESNTPLYRRARTCGGFLADVYTLETELVAAGGLPRYYSLASGDNLCLKFTDDTAPTTTPGTVVAEADLIDRVSCAVTACNAEDSTAGVATPTQYRIARRCHDDYLVVAVPVSAVPTDGSVYTFRWLGDMVAYYVSNDDTKHPVVTNPILIADVRTTFADCAAAVADGSTVTPPTVPTTFPTTDGGWTGYWPPPDYDGETDDPDGDSGNPWTPVDPDGGNDGGGAGGDHTPGGYTPGDDPDGDGESLPGGGSGSGGPGGRNPNTPGASNPQTPWFYLEVLDCDGAPTGEWIAWLGLGLLPYYFEHDGVRKKVTIDSALKCVGCPEDLGFDTDPPGEVIPPGDRTTVADCGDGEWYELYQCSDDAATGLYVTEAFGAPGDYFFSEQYGICYYIPADAPIIYDEQTDIDSILAAGNISSCLDVACDAARCSSNSLSGCATTYLIEAFDASDQPWDVGGQTSWTVTYGGGQWNQNVAGSDATIACDGNVAFGIGGLAGKWSIRLDDTGSITSFMASADTTRFCPPEGRYDDNGGYAGHYATVTKQ